jgi:hypothetical protein
MRRTEGTAKTASELSALRGAVDWRRDQGWISADPTADRRAPARAAVADVCRVTGQARMSYRARPRSSPR